MDDCTFCGIVAGRLPSFRVLEDEHTLAFLDIRPASRGHTLVVPREHAPDIWTISEAAHGRVARSAGVTRPPRTRSRADHFPFHR